MLKQVPSSLPHRIVSNITQFVSPTGHAYHGVVKMQDTACQLSIATRTAGQRYLFGVSQGVNAAGLYESSCWFASCSLMARRLTGPLSPSFFNHAHWPYS